MPPSRHGIGISIGRYRSGGASPLLNNLVSYWKLDEASGTRFDSVGANHLADNNTVTQAVGKLNMAADFVAANSEYLSIVDNASLSTGAISFTFALWAYLNGTGVTRGIGGKWDGSGFREYQVFYTGTRFRFLLRSPPGTNNSVDANTFGAPTAATWYWVCCSYDVAIQQMQISVNSGATDVLNLVAAPDDTASQFWLGQSGEVAFLDGRLDGVGFWKRVLTPAERSQIYNGGAGLDYPFS